MNPRAPLRPLNTVTTSRGITIGSAYIAPPHLRAPPTEDEGFFQDVLGNRRHRSFANSPRANLAVAVAMGLAAVVLMFVIPMPK